MKDILSVFRCGQDSHSNFTLTRRLLLGSAEHQSWTTLWNSNHSSLLMVLLIPEVIKTVRLTSGTKPICAFVFIMVNTESGGPHR